MLVVILVYSCNFYIVCLICFYFCVGYVIYDFPSLLVKTMPLYFLNQIAFRCTVYISSAGIGNVLYLEPLPWYVFTIHFNDVMMVDYFHFIMLEVPKNIAHEIVILNGISFIYMISTANVTLQCHPRSPSGNSLHVLSVTLVGVFRSCYLALA